MSKNWKDVLASLTISIVFIAGAGLLMAAKEAPRSGKWASLEKATLAAHPTCAFCGRPATVVHHAKPFEDFPELELDPANLLALCPECHGTIAHLDRHYDHWNPLVREEIALHRAMVDARPKTKAEAEAFVKRFGKCFDAATYRGSP